MKRSRTCQTVHSVLMFYGSVSYNRTLQDRRDPIKRIMAVVHSAKHFLYLTEIKGKNLF